MLVRDLWQLGSCLPVLYIGDMPGMNKGCPFEAEWPVVFLTGYRMEHADLLVRCNHMADFCSFCDAASKGQGPNQLHVEGHAEADGEPLSKGASCSQTSP